jgi:hypothetical protein
MLALPGAMKLKAESPRPSAPPRRRFVAAVFSMLGSLGCRRDRPMTKRVASMGHDAWVLWPEGEPPPGGWPILLFLHGTGEAAWRDERGEAVEQSPDALFRHGSPVALYRSKDARVKTLWQSFVLIAPQALNDVGVITWWDWAEPDIRKRVVDAVEQVMKSGKVNGSRISAAGFSKGGRGCFRLDSSAPPLQFRKIAVADAQELDALARVVQRRREVRAYYAPSTYQEIFDRHLAAERTYGKATPPVSIIARPQAKQGGEAHLAICSEVFAADELYRWLLA